jgi:hypothetical protein
MDKQKSNNVSKAKDSWFHYHEFPSAKRTM